eukprot:TRINITY_DN753_c0_g1_i1.p4 TRINITY_DN753_c0_g1~~TRINITY_DN753_c0_g1_i1.p4  ORF type:complete len:59 (+),score=17.34 TRINITY_DN753_c0_g1_i1:163-339(+)
MLAFSLFAALPLVNSVLVNVVQLDSWLVLASYFAVAGFITVLANSTVSTGAASSSKQD